MTGRDEPRRVEDWDRFSRTPSLGAHPAFIAELFGGALSEETAARIGRRPRFGERLSRMIAQRHGLAEIDAPADDADRAIALASGEELDALSRRAGAVCWADPIAREIRAPDVAALKEALGDDAYAAALANREEAFSPVTLGLGEPGAEALGRDQLVARSRASGRMCLAAWLTTQPRGVSDRVRLKLSPEAVLPQVDEAYLEYGPAIVRRVAA